MHDAYVGYSSTRVPNSRRLKVVSLKAINAKMCAKNFGVFGLGDRRSHSGRATFLFEISSQDVGGQTVRVDRTIELQIDKSAPQPIIALLPIALEKLFEKYGEY